MVGLRRPNALGQACGPKPYANLPSILSFLETLHARRKLWSVSGINRLAAVLPACFDTHPARRRISRLGPLLQNLPVRRGNRNLQWPIGAYGAYCVREKPLSAR